MAYDQLLCAGFYEMVRDACNIKHFQNQPGLFLYKPKSGLPKINYMQPTADAPSTAQRKSYTVSVLQLSAVLEYHERRTEIVSGLVNRLAQLNDVLAHLLHQSCDSLLFHHSNAS